MGSAPGGSRTLDHYDLDDGDATHPISIDFIASANLTALAKATISWKLRAFRSTANLNPSSVGNEAAHTHQVASIAPGSAGAVNNAATFASGNAYTWNSSVGITGNENTGAGSSHSHSLTGTAQQAVTDGVSSNVTALAVDGVDHTGALGGPWTGDVVELDLTALIPTSKGSWHSITLTLAGLGRVTSVLRFYYGQ